MKLQENLKLKGVYRITLEDIHTGEKQFFEYINLVTADAWELIANHFTDPTPAHSMMLKFAALGTGTDPKTVSDHALQTETYRNNLASKSNIANIAYATAYFNPTEVSGTFREVGIFTEDNVLISTVSINVAKTTSQTLTLDWALTIT